MKLSTRARYAMRLMLEIAKQSDGVTPVSLNKVSHHGELPRRYLEQLAMGLKNAGLVRGVSGKVGGYHLTREPSEIKIGDIVQAVIGPVSIVDCVTEPRGCLKADVCECRLVYTLINQRVTDVLNEFSLGDMLDRKWHKMMIREIEKRPIKPGVTR